MVLGHELLLEVADDAQELSLGVIIDLLGANLIEQVDPSIVGGLVLEARGERRDISVKTQLRIAQETLANSANSYGGEA